MATSFYDDVAAPASALMRPGALSYFEKLPLDRQKALSVFMIARMMASTENPVHLIRLNAIFNMYHFGDSEAGVLTPRKQDLMKLLAVAGNHGSAVRFSYRKAPKKRARTRALSTISRYYDCSLREAATYSVSSDDLLEMAEELGYSKEECDELRKENSSESRGAEAGSSGKTNKRSAARKRA